MGGTIMASIINAGTTSNTALNMTADTSGTLALQSNGTTSATFNSFGIGLGSAVPSSGIGITFPATQSASADANTLDDYEEGTWTPTFSSVTGTITSYAVSQATYTKIGRLVNVSFAITITNNGTGSGAVQLNLPFQSAEKAVGVGRENAVTGSMLQILSSTSSSNIIVWNYSNGYPGGTNYEIIGTLTYRV